MPSLRRAASSSAVRSTPYSARSHGHGHRRVSASHTATRRVLADIEWWRVTHGQCSPTDEDHDQEHSLLAVSDDAGIHIAIVDVDVDASRAPVAPSLPWIPAPESVSPETAAAYGPPTEQFAGLSITPHTPIRRHHALESSTSSTPEAAEAPAEGLGLALVSDLDMGFLDDALPPLSLQRRLPSIFMRPFTLADCTDDHATHYADFAVSPLSSAPDFLN